jgi:hypothetical protein
VSRAPVVAAEVFWPASVFWTISESRSPNREPGAATEDSPETLDAVPAVLAIAGLAHAAARLLEKLLVMGVIVSGRD